MQRVSFIRYGDHPMIHIDTLSECGHMIVDSETILLADVKVDAVAHIHLLDHSKPTVTT